MYNNKQILIIGGTGTFGQKFVETISKNKKIKKIIIYSRDEHKQHIMRNKFPLSIYPNIRFFIGDVRDHERLRIAFNKVDYVIHAAALKHVPIVEYNPFEAIKTNIIGAQNVINAAWDAKVKKVVALSTDKAVSPFNLYGATKLCAEKIFINSNPIRSKYTTFSVVRYGNVMNSRGSLFEVMQKKIKEGKKFGITDKRMTRFHINIMDAINMVNYSIKNFKGGEILIPKIPSFKVLDLVKLYFGNRYFFSGIRKGEKIHEKLFSESESNICYENKKFYLLTNENTKHLKKLGFRKLKKLRQYQSNENYFLSEKELRKEFKL